MQVLVELSAYVPGKQFEQKPANDFAQDCRSPAEHFWHTMQLASLVRFWYLPAGQSLHAPFFNKSTKRPGVQSVQKPSNDFAQDCRSPAGHFAQSTQLVCFDEFWYLFASQAVHDATSEAVEYLPAPHSVHVLAPVPVPVFVIEPAAHVLQSKLPSVLDHLPT